MKAKKLSICILLILFVLFSSISLIAYNKSDSVDIVCHKGSYAEQYAKKHRIDYELIPDSEKYGVTSNPQDFSYNNVGNNSIDIVAYKGLDKDVVIPEAIDDKSVVKISFDALDQGIKTMKIPQSVTSIDVKLYSKRYDANLIIGILIALVGTCISIAFVITVKAENNEKAFLTIPQFRTAYVDAILTFILAGILLAVPSIPDWLIIAAVLLVYGISAIFVVKSKVAVEVVGEVGEKVKVKTFFIKALTVDAEHLMTVTQDVELKAIAKKVYEAVRYSDPMSNALLVEAEDKIQNAFYHFQTTIESKNLEHATAAADHLLSLIDLRNKKCKLLK